MKFQHVKAVHNFRQPILNFQHPAKKRAAASAMCVASRRPAAEGATRERLERIGGCGDLSGL
jgi:hypothetical protein